MLVKYYQGARINSWTQALPALTNPTNWARLRLHIYTDLLFEERFLPAIKIKRSAFLRFEAYSNLGADASNWLMG